MKIGVESVGTVAKPGREQVSGEYIGVVFVVSGKRNTMLPQDKETKKNVEKKSYAAPKSKRSQPRSQFRQHLDMVFERFSDAPSMAAARINIER